MRKPSARYAPLALALSAVAVLMALVVGALTLFRSLGLYLPANPAWMVVALQWSGLVFVLGLALYAFFVPDKVRALLTGRQVRYGSNVFVLALALLVALIALNVFVYRNPRSWDLTEEQARTLAPETLQLLASLPEKVQATGFFSANTPLDNAEELLLDFKAHADGKFDYKFVDPTLNPIVARNAGITGDGKILLQMGARQEIAAVATEEELFRALLRLVEPGQRTVYFLTGHGERDSRAPSEAAVTRASQTLAEKNYTVKSLNLLAEGHIPSDALALIVPGATDAFSAQEMDLIAAWVADGGGLVAMIDPGPLSTPRAGSDPLESYLAETWQIMLHDDLVVDPSVNPPQDAVVSQYGKHPVTQRMNNLLAFFPFARSLDFAEANDLALTPLALSSDHAWGETDLSFLQTADVQPQYNEGEDVPGPVVLALAGENGNGGRVVVFGNSEFVSDTYFDSYGNGDLFINAVDWTAEQDDLISITPRPRKDRVFLAPDNGQLIVIIVGTICLLPGIMLFGGMWAWLRRRRRG